MLYSGKPFLCNLLSSRNGKAIRLTYDHKGSDPSEQQRIRAAGGFITNERVSGMLAITRSLGDAELKEFVSGNPFTSAIDLTEDDELVILACDGVWDVISDQEACEFVKSQMQKEAEKSNRLDPNRLAEALVDLAMNQGSSDNISVIVILLK